MNFKRSVMRFLNAYVLVFTVLLMWKLVVGNSLVQALTYALIWGAAGATAFCLSLAIQKKRGNACKLCDDQPVETNETDHV